MLFELNATLYEEHRKEGGRAIGDILAGTFSVKDVFNGHVEETMLKMNGKYSDKSGHSFYAKLLADHWNFVCDGDAALLETG